MTAVLLIGIYSGHDIWVLNKREDLQIVAGFMTFTSIEEGIGWYVQIIQDLSFMMDHAYRCQCSKDIYKC